jgi:hypothetical protein
LVLINAALARGLSIVKATAPGVCVADIPRTVVCVEDGAQAAGQLLRDLRALPKV